MGNRTKMQRDEMVAFLEELKAGAKGEGSLDMLCRIQKELLDKSFGLVWEEHEEAAHAMMREKIPVFREEKELALTEAPDGTGDFILEGDNLHSLHLLGKTHQGRVDVIYIDPPYNTGNRDFKFDDSFIDGRDVFRHSKWLSFMHERLTAARLLLSETGVIFISIDDNELYELKMLCDRIFGADAFVANLIWQKKTGASDARGIATITEYILVYVKNSGHIERIFDRNHAAHDVSRYRHSDEYEERRGKFYYDSLDRGSVRYSDALNYGIEAPDGTMIYPNGRSSFANDGWTWKWSREKVEWGLKNGFIEISPSAAKKNGWAVRYKIYLKVDNEDRPVDRSSPYKNMITSVLNAHAASDIKDMFDGATVFRYSKPVGLIRLLLSYVRKKDALVLDFFAGSGTTGQAVLEQNAADGGHRRFILCNSNENHICEDIAYRRIRKTMQGYRNRRGQEVKGIPGNLMYYRTEFVSRKEPGLSQALSEYLAELEQLRLGRRIEATEGGARGELLRRYFAEELAECGL